MNWLPSAPRPPAGAERAPREVAEGRAPRVRERAPRAPRRVPAREPPALGVELVEAALERLKGGACLDTCSRKPAPNGVSRKPDNALSTHTAPRVVLARDGRGRRLARARALVVAAKVGGRGNHEGRARLHRRGPEGLPRRRVARPMAVEVGGVCVLLSTGVEETHHSMGVVPLGARRGLNHLDARRGRVRSIRLLVAPAWNSSCV